MAEYRDPTPISPREPEYDKSKVSKEVANYTQQVREKKKGHDVREALARNSEIADIKAEDAVATSYDTKARQDDVENRFDDQIAGNTDIDEVIDARRPEGGEAYPTLRRRLDEEHQEVTAQVAQTNNVVDRFISPENYSSLDEAISEAKNKGKVIQANEIVLEKDVDFRGVALNIGKIIKNSYKITLGGDSWDFNENPTQYIEEIEPVQTGETNKVFIKGASYQTITIGDYRGVISLVMDDLEDENNETNASFIAYNTFNFKRITGIHIKNEPYVYNPQINLWCNENVFNLNSAITLLIEGSYHHNNNRFYGGGFEGSQAKIEFKVGIDNYMYDLRLEGDRLGKDIDVIFSDKTSNNILYLSAGYTPNVLDEGLGNKIIKKGQSEQRELSKYQVKSDTFDSYRGGFKNLETTSNNTLTPVIPSEFTPYITVFESEFYKDPKKIKALLETTIASGNGFVVKYELFNENFENVSAEYSSLPLYMVTSHFLALEKATEGTYFNAGAWRYSMSLEQENKNDVVAISPSVRWREYPSKVSSGASEISYVKFYIGYYRQISGDDLQVYDVRFTSYDISSNFRERYDSN